VTSPTSVCVREKGMTYTAELRKAPSTGLDAKYNRCGWSKVRNLSAPQMWALPVLMSSFQKALHRWYLGCIGWTRSVFFVRNRKWIGWNWATAALVGRAECCVTPRICDPRRSDKTDRLGADEHLGAYQATFTEARRSCFQCSAPVEPSIIHASLFYQYLAS